MTVRAAHVSLGVNTVLPFCGDCRLVPAQGCMTFDAGVHSFSVGIDQRSRDRFNLCCGSGAIVVSMG